MSRLRVLTALTTVVVVLAASPWCFAESITLTSSAGGVYDYGLVVGSGKTVVFADNDTITLSGLGGVTEASVSGVLFGGGFTVNSFTPSSAVFAQTKVPFSAFGGGSSRLTFGTLVVDSSVLTLGTVDFSMQTANEGRSPARRKARLARFLFLNLPASCCSAPGCSGWSASHGGHGRANLG